MSQQIDERMLRRSRPEQDKLDKLPKWAQEYIQRCERDIAGLEAQFARLTDEVEGAENQFVVSNFGRRFSFSERDGYHFAWTERRGQHPRTIQFRSDRSALMGDGPEGVIVQGSEMISIEPQAANTVVIRFVREHE